MRRLWIAACCYAGLGLLAGVVYRTLTHGEFTGKTQLSVSHTHILVLGLVMMLVLIALDAALQIVNSRSFRLFFITYNAGLIVTVGVMVWHGVLQLNGQKGGSALAGVAGLGHILLTVGIAALLVSLSAPIKRHTQARQES